MPHTSRITAAIAAALCHIVGAIRCGIAKVNVATEFQDTFLKALRHKLDELDGAFMPVDRFMDSATAACATHAARLIRLFAGRT